MAVSFNRAISTVTSSGFIISVGLIATGVITAQMVTNLAQENVMDVSVRGGDALWSFVGAFLTLAVVPRDYANPLALGMAGSGALTLVREFNLVPNSS